MHEQTDVPVIFLSRSITIAMLPFGEEARLLDYFDALLSGDLAPNLSGLSDSDEGLEGPKFDAAGTLLMNRKDEDREMFLWAIDRLRRQIISLGAKPVVALPDE